MLFVSHCVKLYASLQPGEVFDASGKAKYHIYGTWDEKIHRDVVAGKSCTHALYKNCITSIFVTR